MKKTFISIVIISMTLISFVLTSCGGKKESNSAVTEKKTESNSKKTGGGKANPESDFVFETNGDFSQIKIIEYIGKSQNAVIPAEIQGIPVTSVILRNQKMKAITLPDSVLRCEIWNCDLLTTLKTSKSLKVINLNHIRNLKSVDLPEGLKAMMIQDTGINELKVPNSLEYIEYCIGNNNLEKITLPDSITLKSPYDSIASGPNLNGYITGEKINSSIALQKLLANIKVNKTWKYWYEIWPEYYW